MKRTLSIIAFISLITLLGGTVNAIPPENTPPQPTTVNETTEKIDLGLLVKAITGFLQSDRYLTSAFLNIPAKERKQIANGSLSDKNVLSYLSSAIDGVIKGNQDTVDSDSFYVYHYKDAKEGFTFSAFVQPDNANLKQVQLVGKSEGLDIVLTEKILNRIANPDVTPQSFTFSPPRGTKKVKSLSITPF